MLTVLDLFSGIGGFSLGLERTGGFKTIAFCEIDPFCRRVLAKHWPGVPCFEDIERLSLERGFADVVCGGFPCQDLSIAGRGEGITGKRSGLWSHLCRIIGEVRPRYAIVENVPRLLSGGRGTWMGKVLGDLAAVGYDAEWHCIPASVVGAPHIRDRVWIVANPQHPNPDSKRSHRTQRDVRPTESRHQQSRFAGPLRAILAHTDDRGQLQQEGRERDQRRRLGNGGEDVADAIGARLKNDQGGGEDENRNGLRAADYASSGSRASHRWSAEPDVGRVAHGVPSRVDRLRSLGNAVVPQIPEIIGRAILEAEKQMSSNEGNHRMRGRA